VGAWAARPLLIKRSFALAGHRTSVALEPEFWAVLSALAERRGLSLAALVAETDARRESLQPLASCLRVLALLARE
jgi:predicted DNA-binding ribbon-helix-helix protein